MGVIPASLGDLEIFHTSSLDLCQVFYPRHLSLDYCCVQIT
jgi:hypothetical protein